LLATPISNVMLMKTVLDVTTPCLVFFLMAVVGLELTADEFRRVARRFPLVALATALQLVLWPLVAAGLAAAMQLQSYIAAGILLVAACPSGGMANLYTALGRGHLALSVTLTAVLCLLGVATTPLVLAVFHSRLNDPAALDVPVPLMLGQLLLLLLLPLVLGMVARHIRPDLAVRHGRWLLGAGLIVFGALLLMVLVVEVKRFAGDFGEISLAVTFLTGIMLLGGWLVGWVLGLGPRDRFALAMVLVVRNVGIATAVAVTVLGRTDFAVFATAYFLTQVPLILVFLTLFRLRRSPEPAPGEAIPS
jgi:BASS family bile acid:Na+ symporter